jgi:hypothetical protein
LFSIDPLSATPLSVSFTNHQDVLLLQFELMSDSFFSVTTAPFNTSERLGPVLGVFYGSPLDEHYLDVVTFPDPGGSDAEFPALGEAVSPSDPSLPGLTPLMLEQGIYLLALLSPQNFFQGVPVSLTATLSLDSEDMACGSDEGCSFSLSFDAAPLDGGPAPVPEPATLTLVAGGALAGWLERRRAKTRKHSAVSR